MRSILSILLLLLSFEISQAQPSKIIFDTDFALDVDDAGSLAILNTCINRGECQLLGIVVSSSLNSYDGKWAVPAIDAINTWYKHQNIPIGIYKGINPIKDDSSHYTKQVQAAFPHNYKPGDTILEGYKLYRKILASQPDHSVKVLTVGFLNNLEQLLKSGPDEYSSLNGSKLVKLKVREWICMGGSYPTGNEEFNFNIYPQSTKYVLSHWPTVATFVGFELGDKVLSGGMLNTRYKKENNPVAMSFYYYCQGNNRSSWDELTTLYAVKGLGKMFSAVRGWNTEYNIDENIKPGERPHGRNVWMKDPAGSHQYLKLQIPVSDMEKILDLLMVTPPIEH